MIFTELIEKYKLEPNQNLPLADAEFHAKRVNYLIKKWEHRFSEGFTFHIDLAILPEIWYKVIDEALGILEKDSPRFKINCVKSKLGGIRFQLIELSDDAHDGILILEDVLFDKNLIY